jgi:hypothetical protein
VFSGQEILRGEMRLEPWLVHRSTNLFIFTLFGWISGPQVGAISEGQFSRDSNPLPDPSSVLYGMDKVPLTDQHFIGGRFGPKDVSVGKA